MRTIKNRMLVVQRDDALNNHLVIESDGITKPCSDVISVSGVGLSSDRLAGYFFFSLASAVVPQQSNACWRGEASRPFAIEACIITRGKSMPFALFFFFHFIIMLFCKPCFVVLWGIYHSSRKYKFVRKLTTRGRVIYQFWLSCFSGLPEIYNPRRRHAIFGGAFWYYCAAAAGSESCREDAEEEAVDFIIQ